MTSAPPSVPRLVARSVEIADPGPLLELLPADQPMAWLRRGEGIVAWGIAAVCRTEGETRFEDASAWWRDVVRVAAEFAVTFQGPSDDGVVRRAQDDREVARFQPA